MIRQRHTSRIQNIPLPVEALPKYFTSSSSSAATISSCRSTTTALSASPDENNSQDSKPDPSILISAKDDRTQQIAFVTAFGALAIGTAVCVNLWYTVGVTSLGNDFFDTIRTRIFPITFGSIFAIVGVLHFVFVENFARIVPPRGTWGGLWQAPTPLREQLFGASVSYEEYHSYWTGIAECIGGLWLMGSGLGLFGLSTGPPAFLLFLLTIGVTPANLFMFTHDANPGGAIPRLQYPFGHLARFVVQCGLLSNFWIMMMGANPPS